MQHATLTVSIALLPAADFNTRLLDICDIRHDAGYQLRSMVQMGDEFLMVFQVPVLTP